MSLMKDLTPAILSAAVGIMAGYSTVASADTVRQVSSVTHELSQGDIALAETINDLIKKCEALEVGYRDLVRHASKVPAEKLASIMSVDELVDFSAKLSELRNLEIVFGSAQVPDQFSGLHVKARRALAKGRSWVAQLHDMTIQSIGNPTVFPGHSSAEGLRALAEHSTARLAELANA